MLETFSYEEKQVGLIEFIRVADLTDDLEKNEREHLVATLDHPFFVSVGWTAANELDPGIEYKFILRDGSLAQAMY